MVSFRKNKQIFLFKCTFLLIFPFEFILYCWRESLHLSHRFTRFNSYRHLERNFTFLKTFNTFKIGNATDGFRKTKKTPKTRKYKTMRNP